MLRHISHHFAPLGLDHVVRCLDDLHQQFPQGHRCAVRNGRGLELDGHVGQGGEGGVNIGGASHRILAEEDFQVVQHQLVGQVRLQGSNKCVDMIWRCQTYIQSCFWVHACSEHQVCNETQLRALAAGPDTASLDLSQHALDVIRKI